MKNFKNRNFLKVLLLIIFQAGLRSTVVFWGFQPTHCNRVRMLPPCSSPHQPPSPPPPPSPSPPSAPTPAGVPPSIWPYNATTGPTFLDIACVSNTQESVKIIYTQHIVYYMCPLHSHAICVRACACDASEVIWQYMAVNSQRSVSVHICVVFVAFNRVSSTPFKPYYMFKPYID